eukprot:gene35686-55383_t
MSLVPEGRPPAPTAAAVPRAPVTHDTARQEEADLVLVCVATGEVRAQFGRDHWRAATWSPDGEFLLTKRTTRQARYSYSLPDSRFAHEVEVWGPAAAGPAPPPRRVVHSAPLDGHAYASGDGCRTGPRVIKGRRWAAPRIESSTCCLPTAAKWHPAADHDLVFKEALDAIVLGGGCATPAAGAAPELCFREEAQEGQCVNTDRALLPSRYGTWSGPPSTDRAMKEACRRAAEECTGVTAYAWSNVTQQCRLYPLMDTGSEDIPECTASAWYPIPMHPHTARGRGLAHMGHVVNATEKYECYLSYPCAATSHQTPATSGSRRQLQQGALRTTDG